jgi:hypothetical protein
MMVQFVSEMQFPYKNISLISDFQHILSDVIYLNIVVLTSNEYGGHQRYVGT